MIERCDVRSLTIRTQKQNKKGKKMGEKIKKEKEKKCRERGGEKKEREKKKVVKYDDPNWTSSANQLINGK